MIVRSFRTAIPWMAAGLLILLSAAQTKVTTATGTTTTTVGTSSIPTTAGNPSTTTNPTPPPSLFLTGRVRLEDGTPPPQLVRIERVCGTATHTEGFTDRKGDFAIQIGSAENASYQDASDGGLRQLEQSQHCAGEHSAGRLRQESPREQIGGPNILGEDDELRPDHRGKHTAGQHPGHRLGAKLNARGVGCRKPVGLVRRRVETAAESAEKQQRERTPQHRRA